MRVLLSPPRCTTAAAAAVDSICHRQSRRTVCVCVCVCVWIFTAFELSNSYIIICYWKPGRQQKLNVHLSRDTPRPRFASSRLAPSPLCSCCCLATWQPCRFQLCHMRAASPSSFPSSFSSSSSSSLSSCQLEGPNITISTHDASKIAIYARRGEGHQQAGRCEPGSLLISYLYHFMTKCCDMHKKCCRRFHAPAFNWQCLLIIN